MVIKRLFDLIAASLGFLLFLPIFVLIAILVSLTSRGGAFYSQTRVGKDKKEFRLLKFRTMKLNSDKSGQLTVGMNDARITKLGGFLRLSKLDEIPQLLNVIKGDMSLVGPRPEVPKYVALYSPEQLKVLSVRPGITDLASIEFIKENELLGKAKNPEKEYVEVIMPKKLALNIQYIDTQSFLGDIKLIFRTFGKILK